MRNSNYQTFFNKETKEIFTWSNRPGNFKKLDNEKRIIRLGKLSANQNPFKQDKEGIYRELYGNKKYYLKIMSYGLMIYTDSRIGMEMLEVNKSVNCIF